jgi:hypothetical protein
MLSVLYYDPDPVWLGHAERWFARDGVYRADRFLEGLLSLNRLSRKSMQLDSWTRRRSSGP